MARGTPASPHPAPFIQFSQKPIAEGRVVPYCPLRADDPIWQKDEHEQRFLPLDATADTF
jgi:hypothetical protein